MTHRLITELGVDGRSCPPLRMRCTALVALSAAAVALTPASRTRVAPPAPVKPLVASRGRLTKVAFAPLTFKKKPAARPSPLPLPPSQPNYDASYWYHPSIHNWGNIGWRGWFHAVFAPLATYVIDRTSYSDFDGGVGLKYDVRKAILANATFFPRAASTLAFSSSAGVSSPPPKSCTAEMAACDSADGGSGAKGGRRAKPSIKEACVAGRHSIISRTALIPCAWSVMSPTRDRKKRRALKLQRAKLWRCPLMSEGGSGTWVTESKHTESKP